MLGRRFGRQGFGQCGRVSDSTEQTAWLEAPVPGEGAVATGLLSGEQPIIGCTFGMTEDSRMASAMRKMAVYLGLVEDDHRYDDRYQDKYDSYEDYEGYDEEPDRADAADRQEIRAGRADADPDGGYAWDGQPDSVKHTTDLARITTLHPRTYNEARTIGEHFREGTPVIMNLTEMVDCDAKRLVDFAAGLIFGLHGSIERVTNKVFLLSPANVEVTAEDKARIAQRGFFNQS